MNNPRTWIAAASALLLSTAVSAQVDRADYERAMSLSDKSEYLTVNVPEPATWIAGSSRFHYRKSVKGGHEFVMMDAATQQRRPAFDHERLATALGTATGGNYTAVRLPFSEVTFGDGERYIEFSVERARWRCELATYACRQTAPTPGFATRRGLGGPVRDSEADETGAKKIAGRQVGSAGPQLQRRGPLDWREDRHAAQHRRLRRQLLRPGVDRVVAGLDQDRGLPRQARSPAPGPLRGVVSGRPAAAEARDVSLHQAG